MSTVHLDHKSVEPAARLLGGKPAHETSSHEDASHGLPIPVRYYEQFGADFTREVPAEGYGGWKTAEVEFDPAETAVVVMHAWDIPSLDSARGWYSAVEGMERIKRVCGGPLARLVHAVRHSPIPLIHIAYPGTYYQHLPGYRRAVDRWPGSFEAEEVPSTRSLDELQRFRKRHAFPGHLNVPDIKREFDQLRFASEVTPMDHEPVVDNAQTLFGLCRDAGINHLIYAGFTVNGCIVLAPAGAEDMRRHGLLCSIVADATTAIENHETARGEKGKAMGLWLFSTVYGFVLDVDSTTRWLAATRR